MKLKVLMVATSAEPGLEKLVLSLQRFGYDFDILGMGKQWTGFKMKMLEVQSWIRNYQEDYTHILFVDAYDVLATGPITKQYRGIVFSCEKACWPDQEKANLYSNSPTPYRFLNSGSYIGEIDEILKVLDNEDPQSSEDDQRFWTDAYLSAKYDIRLDCTCELFQSIAFRSDGDYLVENCEVKNLHTGNKPVIIHGNGRTDMTEIYRTLTTHYWLKDIRWENSEKYNIEIKEEFDNNLCLFPTLEMIRDFVEKNAFGFGERSFYYMWVMIIREMGERFNFLEVGVFRGQILSLVREISNMYGKDAGIWGLTPLDSTDGHWESDYENDVQHIHDLFNLKQPNIIKGLSTDQKAIQQAGKRQYDIVYIDGGHAYEVVKSDLNTFPKMLKKGGLLVIDDCCNSFNVPFGYFAGIEPVTRAVDETLPPFTPNNEFEFLFNVVHNRVYRKL